MNLTRHTDYAMRVLIYAGVHDDDRCSITGISQAYGISRNHLVKVVHELGRHGYLDTARGRGGGIRLARPPAEIVVGDVVRDMEPGFDLLECFDPDTDTCPITPACRLKRTLGRALDAFLGILDETTLADLLVGRRRLGSLLARP